MNTSAGEAPSTVRKIVDLPGPAGNTRSRSVSRHSTRSIPGEFEEEMTEVIEETPRPIRKDKGKEPEKDIVDMSTSEMDISKHPYYQKEGLDNLSEIKFGNWEEFKKLVMNRKEGPRPFAYLARIIQYDEDMFSRLHSSENKNRRYKRLIADLREEKAKEELTSMRVDLEETRNVNDNLRKVNSEMLQLIDELQRQYRETTQSIPPPTR